MYKNESNGHQRAPKRQNHPIVDAAFANDFEGVKKELAINDFTHNDYVAAISRAAGNDLMEMLEYLTSLPINRPEDNEKSFRWAARHNKMRCIKYFVEKLNVPATAFNSAAFRFTAQYGHFEAMKYLHKAGADITAEGNEAIKSAVRFYHDDIGEYLVEHGCSFELTESDFLPSHDRHKVQYRSGTNTGNFHIDKWDLLFRVSSKLDEKDPKRMTKTFKAMIKRGLPQNILDATMIKVASYGFLDHFINLREHGADINAQNVAGLSEAARFGHMNIVTHYLHDEPTLDRSLGIQRALKKSIEGGHEKISSVLLLHINNEKGEVDDQEQLLSRFLKFKQFESSQVLIETNNWLLYNNSDVGKRIVRYGNGELLEECIKNGMQVLNTEYNYVDAAIERLNFDNARILIREGVIPTNLNEVLIIASQYGQTDLVDYLLSLGARADYNNSAALEMAIEHDHTSCVILLRKSGARATDTKKAKSMEMSNVLTVPPSDLPKVSISKDLKAASSA